MFLTTMKYKKILWLLYLIWFSGFILPQNSDTLETDTVNITAKDVINKYIHAIGGRDMFLSIVDKTTIMSGTAMDQPISIMIMQKYPDKLYQEIQSGEVKQFLYYNNGKGTMLIGDEKISLEGKELERLTMDARMRLILSPDSFGVKSDFVGIECLDSIDCYVVRLVLPSGIRWFQYYSAETCLKVKETKEIQTTQGLIEQKNYFSDYREVSGLKFPFTIKQDFGRQEINLTVTSIEINTRLDDKIFEVPE